MEKSFWLIIFISAFLIIPSVSSLGVSPGTVRLNFEPRINTSFEMSIINYPQKSQDAEIYISFVKLTEEVKEDFSKIFSLETNRITLTEQESKKSLNVFVNFPDKVARAGTHEIRIGAMPTASEGSIGIRAGNEIVVLVTVPPEFATNAESKIETLEILDVIAPNTKKGENTKIEILVQSKTETILNNVKAEIKVIQNNQEIEKLSTNQINLNPNEQGTLTAVFDTSKAETGTLNLEVAVFFDSKSTTAVKSLNIYTSTKRPIYLKIIVLTISLLFLIIIAIIILIIHLLKKKKDSDPIVQFRKTF